MSLLVGSMRDFLTFDQWMSSEAIEPISVPFGDNPPSFNNKHILKFTGGDIWGVCFVFDDKLYAVQLHKGTGEIAFGASLNVPNTIEELNNTKFTDNRVFTSSGLKVVNYVFYALLTMLDELHKNSVIISELFFSAAHSELGSIYKLLANNRFFNTKLNQHGYENLTVSGDKYIIKKVADAK
jgi:hypothetical protein